MHMPKLPYISMKILLQVDIDIHTYRQGNKNINQKVFNKLARDCVYYFRKKISPNCW